MNKKELQLLNDLREKGILGLPLIDTWERAFLIKIGVLKQNWEGFYLDEKELFEFYKNNPAPLL